MTPQILYQKTRNGKVSYWKSWAEGAIVIAEHGPIDGNKPVTHRYQAEATNVGRKNERTAEQQALFEIQSSYNTKLDKKYCTSIEEALKGKFLPMTAKDTVVESIRSNVKYPAYIQRKYNGVRCMANWRKLSNKEQIYLMSRGNKQYHVNHIEEILKTKLDKKDAYDGELYLHGTRLQTINSLVKKWKGGSEKLTYVIYDVPIINGNSTVNQKDRMKYLKELSTKFKNTNLVVAETFIVKSFEEAKKYEKQFIKEGYEGAIIRTYDGIYEFGNDSDSLLKVKSFKDAEFEVVNYDVEKTNVNNNPIDAVVWICKNDTASPDGTTKTFEVRPKGTFLERAELLKNVKDYIGKKLTVKYFERTADNIPLHGTGLHFRLEEDLPDED